MSDEQETFGRQDINECIQYLRKSIGIALDGSAAGNRKFCSLLINSLHKDYPGVDAVAMVKRLADIALSDQFHRLRATGMHYLYYNRAKLILLGRQQRGDVEEKKPVVVVNGLRKLD